MGEAVALSIDEHPRLDAVVFMSTFPMPLGELTTPESVTQLFRVDAESPLERNDETRKAVRDLLRFGGYKPTGRGKPASEYLVKAAESEKLGTINLAVDILNAVSLHSGLPISVVDTALAKPPYRIGLAGDESYVFNPSGQEIQLAGLLCLFDAEGPCANAVKDCQRTKTHPGTERTLSVIWGTRELPGVTKQTFEWYRTLLVEHGATVEVVSAG